MIQTVIFFRSSEKSNMPGDIITESAGICIELKKNEPGIIFNMG